MYFWPKMVDPIKLMVPVCERCLKNSPSQQRKPLIQKLASEPMEQVSIDLTQYARKTYLVLTDQFSGWIMTVQYKGAPDQLSICKTLEGWFLDVGRPVIICFDSGPQFRSGFDSWCQSMSIKHELSSAYNPQCFYR